MFMKKPNIKGFTLIELIVVIVLISMMFSFALPKMDSFLFIDNRDKVSRWVILNVQNLKNLSVKNKIRYILHVDTQNNMFWISSEGMDEAAQAEAMKNGYKLPNNIRLVDVVYPSQRKDDERSDIYFYTRGYSDQAIIHMENSDNEKMSFVIEPFLPPVGIKDGFVMFDE